MDHTNVDRNGITKCIQTCVENNDLSLYCSEALKYMLMGIPKDQVETIFVNLVQSCMKNNQTRALEFYLNSVFIQVYPDLNTSCPIANLFLAVKKQQFGLFQEYIHHDSFTIKLLAFSLNPEYIFYL